MRAYCSGYSTETAFQRILDSLYKAINSKQLTVMISLDTHISCMRSILFITVTVAVVGLPVSSRIKSLALSLAAISRLTLASQPSVKPVITTHVRACALRHIRHSKLCRHRQHCRITPWILQFSVIWHSKIINCQITESAEHVDSGGAKLTEIQPNYCVHFIGCQWRRVDYKLALLTYKVH